MVAYPWTLFRGQAIGAKVSREGTLLRVTLDCEDYNRLFERSLVGAPDGMFLRQEEDGSYIPFDPYSVNDSSTDAELFIKFMQRFWTGPTVDLLTYSFVYRLQQDDDVDWSTALTDLRSVFDEWAARTTGTIRYWIDPDLYAHWQACTPVEPLYAQTSPDELGVGGFLVSDPNVLPAPYDLDNDTPNWSTSIMPKSLEASWDFSKPVLSVYVKGGTVAPEGSGWVGVAEYAPPYSGQAYIDAPGSILAADRQAIATYHFAQEFRDLLTGSASVASLYDGWRVGQTVYVSDVVLSRLLGRELADAGYIIQRVTGKLVSPGPGLGISIDGVDISDKVAAWDTFDFEETLGSAGKATVVIELVTADIDIASQADVQVWTTGTAEVEYDLEFGDIPAQPLAREAKTLGDMPGNRFIVTVQDPHIPVGQQSLVTAQFATAAGKPLPIANVYCEWILLQWGYEGAGDVQFWLDAVHKMQAHIAVYQAILDEGGTLTAKQQAAMDQDEATLAHNQEMLDAALAKSTTEVAFWTAAVAKMQGYVDAYAAIIAGGGTLTAKQQTAFDTDKATLAYDQQQLAAAIAAQGEGPRTPGTGFSLQDVSGITDPTGRAFTYLVHDEVGTTVELEVDAVALPIN